MEDISRHLDASATTQTATNGSISKKYVLNVNFAGNDMYESYIRVILETEKYGPMMNWFLACEAKGGVFEMNNELLRDPPPCLFYYGYLSWVNI